MKVQDVASLIAVRNFAFQSVDNLAIKMSREEIKALQNKVPQLDKIIIDGILSLDLTHVEEVPKKVMAQKVTRSQINNEATK